MRRLPGLILMYLSLKFVRGYHCLNKAIGKLVKLLHITFLNKFNFLQLFKIILKSSFFTSKPLFESIFASLYTSSEKLSFEMDSSAFPWRQDFNHIIWYLVISSESSTMLWKVVEEYSNFVLLPLNIGNLFYLRFLSTDKFKGRLG